MPRSSVVVRSLAFGACLACLGAPVRPLAHDGDLAPASPGARASGHDGYGWELLLVDLASTGLMVGGSFAAQDGGPAIAIPIIGAAGYLAGGPLLHLAHGERDRATRSALWRLLAPLGAGALGAGLGALAAGSGSSDVCSSRRACGAAFGGGVGAGAGMLAAMAIDWGSASPRPLAPSSPAGPLAAGEPAWAPAVVVGPLGAVVAVAARF